MALRTYSENMAKSIKLSEQNRSSKRSCAAAYRNSSRQVHLPPNESANASTALFKSR